MANSDKDILITPNTGQSAKPKIEVTGADNSTKTITINDDGTLSFDSTIAATTGSVADGNANLVTGDAVFDYIAAQNFAASGASNFVVGDITGQTELTSGLASTDELVLSDAGALKRMDVSVLQSYMQSNLTFTTDTILTTENVQDIVGGMFSSNTETGISATYEDSDGTIDLNATGDKTLSSSVQLIGATTTNLRVTTGAAASSGATLSFVGSDNNVISDLTIPSSNGTISLSDTQLTTEQVQDIVGAMFTSNTETRVSATYEDGDGTIDLVVDDMTADTNTQLSTEQVQDIVGAMLVGTETRIGVTYDDTNGRINFVVDDMTANTQLTLLDEDNFATNSATAAASQQSIKAYVDSEVAGLVDSSPSALNTLNELAAALGDDASFSTTTATSLGNRLRVDVSNQGLTSTQQGNALTNLGITASLAEINILDDGLAASDIPNLASSKITSGTLGTARIPSLATSKITSGTFADARIAESNITQHLAAGTGLSLSGKTFSANLSASDIPNLAASKITSGTFATARIADDAITSAKIADDAIITALIADDQITNALMADDAIDSAQLADASIDEVHLNATNSPTDNYLLSYDSASGGFTWVVSPSGGGDVRTVTAGGNTLGASETLAFTAGNNIAISEGGGAVTISSVAGNVQLANSIALSGATSNNLRVTTATAASSGVTLSFVGSDGNSIGNLTVPSGNGTISTSDTQLTTEAVQDIVGGMFGSNTETRISATYQDGDGTIDLVVDDMTANDNTQLSTEQVQDIVGAMFGSNTETRISATYQDGDGTIDLVVDDMTADTNTNQLTTFTLTGDSGSNQTIAHGNTLDIAGGTGIDTVVGNTDTVTVAIDNTVATLSGSQTLSNKTIAISQVTELSNLTADEGAQLENIGSTTISATQWGYLGAASGAITNTDTQLSTEQVQDIVGAMFGSNTETRISATYQDGDGTIDLVVDDMTADTNTQLSTEQVQDIVGGMLVGTETRIGVSYDDTNGRINFVVDDMTANTQLTLLDQDDMSSNSATAAASQQSIKAYVDAEVAGLVASAPSALNTLNELAAALGDDASFSTTTATSLGNRLRIDVNNQGLNSTQQGNALTNLGITASLAEINILDDGLAASDIPNLATSKITSGTFADDRIAQSNVTQHLAVGSGGGIGLSGKTFSLDIDGMTDIGAALVDADLMIVDDGADGTNRKATMSTLKTYMQNNLSFTTNTNLSNENVMDIAGPLVATGGTKTRIAVTYDDDNNNMDFVVDDMNFSVSDITGATALTSGLAATDELVLSDAGTLKRMDVSVLQDYMQGSLTFTTNTNTQRAAGTNISLSGNTLNVDDAFLKNDADDTTSGTLTAAALVSNGAITVGSKVLKTSSNAHSFGNDTQEFHTGSTNRMDISDSGVRFGGSGARITTINTGFTDNDTSLMTSQAIKEKIENYNYITSQMTFVLEDDDGTEVSISDAEEIKFHSGDTSVDINYSDISPGSDSDPFDLDFRTIHAPYLKTQDDRDFAPDNLNNEIRELSGRFSTKTGLEDGSTTNAGDYVDVLVLDTFTGHSGGDANILAFAKNSTKRIYHYRADQDDTDWGTASTVAYTSDVPTTEAIQDIVGAMFSSNTETNITATYQDSDGTIDLVGVAGDITAVTAGTGLTGGGSSGAVTVNVIGGTGITANANDVAITAAQTGITSVFNTGLAIGYASNGASIDFGTDNQITFAIDGTQQINLFDGGLIPETNNDVDLGSSDKMFKDAHFRGTLEANAITIQGVAVTAGGGSGDITAVVAGNGLTGGATSGSATLNIGAGTGIDVAADAISVDVSDFMSNGSNNRIVTATGTDGMNAESNLTWDGSTLIVSGGAGDAVLSLRADSDNSGELDQPYIDFMLDGTTIHSSIGHSSDVFHNDSTDNNTLIIANSVATNASGSGIVLATGSSAGHENAVEALRIGPDRKIRFNDTYTFPLTDGSNGQVLTTNGSGSLSFTTVSGGGSSTTGSFYITAEESNWQLNVGVSNGFHWSFGNGSDIGDAPSTNSKNEGIALPVDCTLKFLHLNCANDGNESAGNSATVQIYKATSATATQSAVSNATITATVATNGHGISATADKDIDFNKGDVILFRSTTANQSGIYLGRGTISAYFVER